MQYAPTRRPFMAAALACSLVVAGCGRGGVSRETISLQGPTGQIDLTMDDGTAGGPLVFKGTERPAQMSDLRRRHDPASGPSLGSATVFDGRAMILKAHAEQGKPPAKAEIKSIVNSVSRSTFTLKQDNRPTEMKIEMHWYVELSSGQAVITVDGNIDNLCTVAGSFTLETAPKDAKRIVIASKGGTTSSPGMTNPGGISAEVPGTGCTLNAGPHNVTWSVDVRLTGDPMGELSINSAHLVLR